MLLDQSLPDQSDISEYTHQRVCHSGHGFDKYIQRYTYNNILSGISHSTGIPRFPLHPSGVHVGVHEETGLTLIILLGGKVKHTPSFFRVVYLSFFLLTL